MRATHNLLSPWLSRLHRDEQGATITEFVIVLPVFVLIFSFTLALSRMQHTGIQVQIEASKAMWTEAIEIQTDTDPMPDTTYTSAQAGGQNAEIKLGTRTQPSPVQALMTQRWQQAQADGHMGEAQAMVNPIQNYMPTNFGLDAYSKLHSAHSRYQETPMALTNSVGNLFDPNSKRAAFNLLNDSSSMSALPTSGISQPSPMAGLYPLLDSTTPEGTIYNQAAGMIGSSRLAIATGTRYGVAQGISDAPVTHPLIPGSPTLKAGFETLIAPKAQVTDDERARTNYVSHMTLMNESLYSTLLAIDYDETFVFDDNY